MADTTFLDKEYQYGFKTDAKVLFTTGKGLNADVVRAISKHKHGIFLAMKSAKGREELAESKNALDKLGAKVTSVQEENLPNGEGVRLNIQIEKLKPTEHKYPRTWVEIEKKPL